MENTRVSKCSPTLTANYVALLKACAQKKDLHKGTRVHAAILKTGLLEKNIYVANSLVSMYAKCGAHAKAAKVLGELPVRDVVSWSALIAGYSQQGHGKEALQCFQRMQCEGLCPNAVTFTSILKACGSIGAVDKGKQIHEEIVRQGLLGKDILLGSALVDMYAKCGVLTKAQHVLDKLPARELATWNALITGYAQQGQGEEALNSFEQMQQEGFSPNVVTFISILRACGTMGAADKGEEIHREIVRRGFLDRNNICIALVHMYANCGALAKAQQVFDNLPTPDVVSWSALIAGYAQQGQGEEALKCFEQMQHEGLSPNAVTFTCILKACGSIGALEKGIQIHDEIVRQGLLGKDIVLGTALVDMYAKCGALTKAHWVLDKLPARDVVSWSTLIAGYAQHAQGEEALNCFERMQLEGFFPDVVTFTCTLKACGSMGTTDKGQQIHEEIIRQGLLRKNSVLGIALVDMYAKCGELAKAQEVLDDLPVRGVVCWNALVAGYVQQGHSEEVLNSFERMQHEGLSPNSVTLACVLNSCSHLGLLEDGQRYFVNMKANFGITPTVEHYTCMADLFGRAGDFERALAVIKKMPSSNYLPVWSALLGASQKWGNVKVGQLAFEHAVQVDRTDAAAYICMANIYAAAGMQEDADKVEAMRMKNKA